MKIRFIESCSGIGISFAKGEERILPDGIALKYISMGLAETTEEIKEIQPERPLKPIVQEIKKSKSRPQKRNVKTRNSKNK